MTRYRTIVAYLRALVCRLAWHDAKDTPDTLSLGWPDGTHRIACCRRCGAELLDMDCEWFGKDDA